MNYPDDYINRIIQGDCLEVMKGIPDNSVDMVLTDPPYGLNYRSPRGAKTGNLKEYIANDKLEEYIDLLSKIRVEFERIMKTDSEAYICCAGGGGEPVLAYAWLEYKKSKILRVKNLLVWDKQFVGMGWDWRFQYETIFQLQKGKGLDNNMQGSTRSNVLRCNNVIPQKDQHPTEKPVELMAKILRAKPSAKIVLDPFLGSGTTAVACKMLDRNYIGIELSEKYCNIARDRIENTLPLFNQEAK